MSDPRTQTEKPWYETDIYEYPRPAPRIPPGVTPWSQQRHQQPGPAFEAPPHSLLPGARDRWPGNASLPSGSPMLPRTNTDSQHSDGNKKYTPYRPLRRASGKSITRRASSSSNKPPAELHIPTKLKRTNAIHSPRVPVRFEDLKEKEMPNGPAIQSVSSGQPKLVEISKMRGGGQPIHEVNARKQGKLVIRTGQRPPHASKRAVFYE